MSRRTMGHPGLETGWLSSGWRKKLNLQSPGKPNCQKNLGGVRGQYRQGCSYRQQGKQVEFQWLITGGSRDSLDCELAEAGSAWLWDKGMQGTWRQWRVSPLHLPYSGDSRQCVTAPELLETLFPAFPTLQSSLMLPAISTELDSRELGGTCQINKEFRG